MADVNLNIGGNASELLSNLKEIRQGFSSLSDEAGEFSKDVNKGFSDATSGSKKLTQEQQKTNKALKATDAELKDMAKSKKKATATKDVKNLNKELAKTEKAVGKTGKSFGGLGGLLKGALGPLAAVFAGGALIGNSINTIRNFSKSLDELASITGLDQTSEGFKTLEANAKELGRTTTLSASEVVNAFKLIGSAKPELLQDAEALTAVTEQTIILSEASGEELGTSVSALTGIMNQFGLDATDAAETVDILANASQLGAAAIPQVSEAITKFGVQAAAANVKVIESVGAIEVLAEKGIVGAEAGTKLRNVLTKLSTAKSLPKEALDQMQKFGVDLDVVTDNSLSFEERLKEMSKISGDATAVVKVFGAENIAAGKVLLDGTDRLHDFTDGFTSVVDGQEVFTEGLNKSGTAQEQAQQNTDNLDGALKGLNSAWEGLVLSFSSADGVLQGIVEFFKDFVNAITDNIDVVKTIGKVLVPIIGLILLYAAANKAVAIQTNLVLLAEKARAFFTKVSAAAMKIATAAQWVWNAAMNANPVGIFILALAALATGIAIMATAMALSSSEMEKNALVAKLTEEATANLSKAFTTEATEVDKAFNKLQDKSTSTEDYAQILADLETQYNINLDQYKDENGLLEDLEGAQRAVNTAVLEGIVAKQKAEAQNKLYAASVANEVSLANVAAGVIDEGADDALGFWEKAGLALVDSFESIPDKLSAAGSAISGDLEGAAKTTLESQAKLEAKFEAKRLANLKQAGADIKAELEVIDEVYDEAGKAVEKNLGTLALGFADGLEETAEEVEAAAAKVTADQKKESEKRAKARLKENNALFKAEQDFQKALDALIEKAESGRVKGLTGDEKIEAEKQIALEEIDILEDGLKRKLAIIELERTTTSAQLARLSAEEKEARIQGLQDNIELEESQQALLGQLKQQAITKSNDDLIKFIFAEEKRVADAEGATVTEEIKAVDLAEQSATQQVEVDSLDIDSELLREQFKEEQILKIREQSLKDKADLIAREEQLKIESLERELVTLEGQEGQEVELRKEALNKQIDNAEKARDIVIQGIALEQAEIRKQLDKITEEKSKFNLGEALGLTPEEFESVKESLSQIGTAIFDEINKATEEQLNANATFIDQIEGRIDEVGEALEREIELNRIGFASNIEGEKAKLANLKEQREKAFQEQKKLQKRQAVLDQIAVVGKLVLAVASIIASEAKAGVIGLAIAAAAIPVLFGIFAAAKGKASQGGFYEGGYTGNVGVRERAGDVHGQEFVMTAEKTKKHRGLFEAIHTGNLPTMQNEMLKLLEDTGISMSPDIVENFENRKEALTFKVKERDAGLMNQRLESHLAKVDMNLETFLDEFKNKETVEHRDGLTIKKKGNLTKYIRHGKT